MFMRFLLFFFFTGVMFADTLDDKIRQFVEPEKFVLHQKLLEKIFEDKQSFYLSDGKVDLFKVTNTLKSNGLLELYFETPQQLQINYATTSSPVAFTKMVSDSLKALGYYYFTTQKAKYHNGEYRWNILFDAEYSLDPAIFISELEKRGGVVDDIKKVSATQWDYRVEISHVTIPEAIEIAPGKTVMLNRTVDDYWVSFEQTGSFKITADSFAIWHPYVVLYDQDLNILKIHRYDERKKAITISIPTRVRYAKITDMYSVNNIKNGLSVRLRNR